MCLSFFHYSCHFGKALAACSEWQPGLGWGIFGQTCCRININVILILGTVPRAACLAFLASRVYELVLSSVVWTRVKHVGSTGPVAPRFGAFVSLERSFPDLASCPISGRLGAAGATLEVDLLEATTPEVSSRDNETTTSKLPGNWIRCIRSNFLLSYYNRLD